MGNRRKSRMRDYKYHEFFGNLDTEKEFPIKVYKNKSKDEDYEQNRALNAASKKLYIVQWKDLVMQNGMSAGIDPSSIKTKGFSTEFFEENHEWDVEDGYTSTLESIIATKFKVIHDPREDALMTPSVTFNKKPGRPKKNNVESKNNEG